MLRYICFKINKTYRLVDMSTGVLRKAAGVVSLSKYSDILALMFLCKILNNKIDGSH